MPFPSFLGGFGVTGWVGGRWVWYTSELLGRLPKASAESGYDRVVKKTKSPRDASIFIVPPLIIIPRLRPRMQSEHIALPDAAYFNEGLWCKGLFSAFSCEGPTLLKDNCY